MLKSYDSGIFHGDTRAKLSKGLNRGSGLVLRSWLLCCVCVFLYSVFQYISVVSRSLSVPCPLLGRCIARS